MNYYTSNYPAMDFIKITMIHPYLKRILGKTMYVNIDSTKTSKTLTILRFKTIRVLVSIGGKRPNYINICRVETIKHRGANKQIYIMGVDYRILDKYHH